MKTLGDSSDSDVDDPEGGEGVPYLFRFFDRAQPARPPARYSLAGVEEIELVRGTWSRATRSGDGRRLVVVAEDPRMSETHAYIRRAQGGFVLQDLRSKNGTFLDGAEVRGEAPCEGRIVQCGTTFFRVRGFPGPDAGDDERSGDRGGAPPGTATLLPTLARDFDVLRAIAASRVAVFLTGETGVGKELAAAAVHAWSGRGGRDNVVAFSCANVTVDHFESEMFGVAPGVFTGVKARQGLIAESSGGTLFLDEVGEMPAGAQAKFLRVLDQGEVRRLGATGTVKVDLRVVSATKRDLKRAVQAGTFREDLWHRLCGHEMRLPPLRERIEDFGIIVAEILAEIRRRSARGDARPVQFTARAAHVLFAHAWPGNNRQLRNAVETALVLAQAQAPKAQAFVEIRRRHLPRDLFDETGSGRDGGASPPRWPPTPEELRDALQRERGNQAEVARKFGKSRTRVQQLCKKYKITPR